MKYNMEDCFNPVQQDEIEALKAQVVTAEKKAYWAAFEHARMHPDDNDIQSSYLDWLNLRKINADYIANRKDGE